MGNRYFSPYLTIISSTLLSFCYLTAPTVVLAGAGHSHGNEFQDGGGANVEATSVVIDPEIAQGIQIKTQEVKRQRLPISIKTTGQVEALPNQQVEITNPVTGTIAELLVKPGDIVKSGQPVAVISSPELIELRVNAQEQKAIALSELKQAKAELKLAQENYNRTQNIFQVATNQTQLASLDISAFESNSVLAVARENLDRQKQIAQAEIESAKIELSVAQEQYKRDQELAEKGAIPKRQMRESQAKYAAAQAQLTQVQSRSGVLQADSELKQASLDFRRELAEAQSQVEKAQSAVEVAEEKVRLSESTYQTRLAQLNTSANEKGLVTVFAPIAGRIGERSATLGQSFQDAGGKLMTIVNDSRVFITANVYEKDLGRVKKDQVVIATFTNLPNETFRGVISVIGSTVQGESRIVPVKAEIDNIGGKLKPGMFANLEIVTNDNVSDVLVIPQSAIVEANNKNLVYVENGNGYQAVEVTLGETTGDLVEVKTGLFEGDVIVTQRAPQLYAQALKGGGETEKATTDEHSEESMTENHSEEETTAKNNLLTFPLWIQIGIGGILAGGMFWVGSIYGNRQRQKIATTLQHEFYDVELPMESLNSVETLEAVESNHE
jgi:cobalt-zinc-cadmium efflux system membrane fusion protein